MGESLSAANYVIGALSPATWYEVLVEARNDAGAERVLLLADTHTLAGGEAHRLRRGTAESIHEYTGHEYGRSTNLISPI